MTRPIRLLDEQDTLRLAARVAAALRGGELVVLSGGLGVGKTFFAGALARALGLPEDVPVTSPTYALATEYETSPPLCHADLYRLGVEEEVADLGLEERRERGAVLLVEWGRPFVEVLGGDAVELELEQEGGDASPSEVRLARLSASGPRSAELVRALEAGE
jgi:tRNA threonylcarbamoyladenosine biosynthesis protein TsaE